MNATNAAITGVLFLITLASGYWLSSVGRPLNQALFTLHKVVPVGMAVYVILLTLRVHRGAGLPPGALPAAIATAVLLFITVATGGALALFGKAPSAVRLLHAVLPYATGVCGTVLCVALLRTASGT